MTMPETRLCRTATMLGGNTTVTDHGNVDEYLHFDKEYYYGSPWEAEADRLGGVNREEYNTPWPEEAYILYDLIKLF